MKRRISVCLRQISISVIYFPLRLAILIIQALPIRFGLFLADLAGNLSFLISPGRRQVVANNLKHISGVKADSRILKDKTRKVFVNVARNYFDLTRVSSMNPDKLAAKTTIEGWEHLVKARSGKKGVVIATAHLGNFELGAQAIVNRGIEMTILVEEFSSNPIREQIAKLRKRKGVRILPVTMQGMKEAYYDLLRGGTLTIVCDRDILGNGLKINFMGEETTLPFGAVSLAQRTGAALVPIFSVRTGNNNTLIYIEPPLNLINDHDREESLRANVTQLASIMEKYICKYPEQWAILEPFWQNGKGQGR